MQKGGSGDGGSENRPLIQPSLDVIPAGLFRASLLPLHPIRNQPYLRIYYVPLTLPIIEDEN